MEHIHTHTHTLSGVHPEFLNGGTDAEATYNLCFNFKNSVIKNHVIYITVTKHCLQFYLYTYIYIYIYIYITTCSTTHLPNLNHNI